MPAKSKAQQRLFALVHQYQQGKLPNASGKIKQIAKHISPEEAEKYASTSHAGLSEVLTRVFNSPEYIHETLMTIIETKHPDYVKGFLVDVFTAQMLLTVSGRLNEDNRSKLFQQPMNEMVALAYKILTY